ncbi:acyl-CoA thioesterase [uncultured Jatrophihabitans sp.]|uniref:acyl-CoA thioesterase n=1 Tax=uncultured Jatrophihabitans sp. TaxID=1610747 RepID=UPI0035CC002E
MRSEPRFRSIASYPVVRVLETLFSDMDIQRHVNNVAITRYFEEARSALRRAVAQAYPGQLASVVLASVEVHYLREVSYPGPVQVGIGTGRLGTTSWQSLAGLFQDGECVALSRATDIRRTADRTAGQRLTEQERAALAGFAVGGEAAGTVRP